MKDRLYTELICSDFCCYFKPGREELKCGAYQFLKENLSSQELRGLSEHIPSKEDLKISVPAENRDLFNMVCNKCDFLIDGCDYRDGLAAPPCGGYILINRLVQ